MSRRTYGATAAVTRPTNASFVNKLKYEYILLEGDVAGEEVCGAHATHLATRPNRLLPMLQASFFHRTLLLFGRISVLHQFHAVQWRNTAQHIRLRVFSGPNCCPLICFQDTGRF